MVMTPIGPTPLLAGFLTLAPVTSAVSAAPAYGPALRGFAYSWSVKTYRFRSLRVDLRMACMDVTPSNPNGRVAVLLAWKELLRGHLEGTVNVSSQAPVP
jgi:hypothetical protein